MDSWYSSNDIGRIQIEITNYCNAACPLCVRSENLESLNNTNITFQEIKDWLGLYSWPNLKDISLCGNVDEPVINPEIIEIVEYFLELNDSLTVIISSNGGCRSVGLWKKLGEISKQTGRLVVIFGIDGLEDTNHIYRRNVVWKRLQENFRAYINNGGIAIWQFIVFEHNKHQIDEAQKTCKEEGFKKFKIRESSRKNRNGIVAAKYFSSENIKDKNKNKEENLLTEVVCAAKPYNSNNYFYPTYANLYISHTGLCLPCCFYDSPKEKKYLTSGTDSDLKQANLNYYKLDEIINGPVWDFINQNIQTSSICKRKCSVCANTDKSKYFSY